MISSKHIVVGILGNVATTLSFLPFIPNFLHKIRGVKFANYLTVYFARDVIIDNRYPEQIFIDNGAVISSRSIVLSHSFIPRNNRVISKKEIIKSVYIGKNVFIGANSVILPGSYLGNGCYVGAGSVVSGRFERDCLVAGNPATVKRII
tara:strand:- start:137 stop:583 length:447 start_codon:yes stop_codon:yes gene_type:complete